MAPCTDLDSDNKNQVQRPSLWLWHSCWLSYNPAYKSNLKNNHQNEHDHRQHWYLKRLIVALFEAELGFVFHLKDKDKWVAAFQIVDSYWRDHLYEYDFGSCPEKTSPATLTSVLTKYHKELVLLMNQTFQPITSLVSTDWFLGTWLEYELNKLVPRWRSLPDRKISCQETIYLSTSPFLSPTVQEPFMNRETNNVR